jgi:hypothetical protein
MQEELSSRLSWVRTSRGIQIEIPGRRNGAVALYAPLVVIWLVLATIHYSRLLGPDRATGSEFTLQLIAVGIYAVGFCFFVCWLAWALTSDTVLSLDRDELKIQRRVMGIDVTTRRFQTSDASRLRYVPPTRSWGDKNTVNPTSSKIQFQTHGKVYTIASGITEPEAASVIGWMHSVHRFPG